MNWDIWGWEKWRSGEEWKTLLLHHHRANRSRRLLFQSKCMNMYALLLPQELLSWLCGWGVCLLVGHFSVWIIIMLMTMSEEEHQNEVDYGDHHQQCSKINNKKYDNNHSDDGIRDDEYANLPFFYSTEGKRRSSLMELKKKWTSSPQLVIDVNQRRWHYYSFFGTIRHTNTLLQHH